MSQRLKQTSVGFFAVCAGLTSTYIQAGMEAGGWKAIERPVTSRIEGFLIQSGYANSNWEFAMERYLRDHHNRLTSTEVPRDKYADLITCFMLTEGKATVEEIGGGEFFQNWCRRNIRGFEIRPPAVRVDRVPVNRFGWW